MNVLPGRTLRALFLQSGSGQADSRLALPDPLLRRTIEEMIGRIEHVKLETTSDFFEIFVEGCMFRPMKPPESAS